MLREPVDELDVSALFENVGLFGCLVLVETLQLTFLELAHLGVLDPEGFEAGLAYNWTVNDGNGFRHQHLVAHLVVKVNA